MQAYNKKLKEPSRRLRCEMTDAEQHLWSRLRRKQIHGVQFNRQKPILNYIVDFYCAKAKLVIELDGSQHYEPEHQEKDQVRDQTLAELGLLVLRYDNRQVLLETEAVVEDIYAKVGERLGSPRIPPGPSFSKGGIEPLPSPFFDGGGNATPPTPSPFEKGGPRGIKKDREKF